MTLNCHEVLQICTRCVLRFLNVRSVDFSGAIPSPSSLLAELKPPLKTNGNAETSTAEAECEFTPDIEKPATKIPGDTKDPCIVCLGALHLLVDEGANLHKIEEVVRKDGYVFNEFCLEVSVPAISVVRERSLWYISILYSISLMSRCVFLSMYDLTRSCGFVRCMPVQILDWVRSFTIVCELQVGCHVEDRIFRS